MWNSGLFAGKRTLRAPDVAKELGLSERMARNLLTGWVEDGWLEVTNPSRRARAYSLSAKYRQLIGNAPVREEQALESGQTTLGSCPPQCRKTIALFALIYYIQPVYSSEVAIKSGNFRDLMLETS